ncbi:two-component regulator propeller domain-containing protein [Bacteroidota bacterium]
MNEERIWDIHWTANNECYVATEEQGVVHFTEDNLLNQYTKVNGIKTNQIYRITESTTGDIWFSTLGNGILKFENKLLVNYHDGAGIKGNQIFDVEIDNNGEIMIGSDEGFSIYTFQGDQVEEIANYGTKDGLPSNDITSVSSKNGEIWLGSSNGLAQILNGRVRIPDFNAGLLSPKVNCLLQDSQGNLWIGTDNGYNLYMNKDLYRVNEDRGFINNEVQTIIEHSNGDIWMGTLGGLVRLRGTEYTDFNKEDGLIELSIHAIAENKNGDLWLGTFGGGIFMFSEGNDSIPISLIAGNDILSSNNIYSLEFLSDSVLIAGTESGFDHITIGPDNQVRHSVHYDVNDGYPGGGNNLNALAIQDDLVWFGNSEGLVRFDPSQQSDQAPPELQINRLKLFFEEQDWKTYGPTVPWFNLPHDLMLPYKDDHLTIGFSSIFYGNHNGISYSYFLEGQSKDWSPYLQSMEVDFPGLRPGKYNFQVKAKNKYGIEGDTESFSFEIKPPFWMRPWFIILVVIILIASVILYVNWRTRKLQLEKIRLEKIVEERTHEVVKQKEEIERQHDIVVKQNDEIEASIHYAERIQKAVVPSEDLLKHNFDDSFILWRPQHIVSGDFYWVGEKNNIIIFTAADCTGHGVPGAFMSMLGVSYLNQIVLEESTTDPGKILDKLRDHIINSFSQKEQGEAERKDGMDIAMCAFNKKTKKLYYSGAYNPLYLVRHKGSESEIIEYSADKMPVGLYAIMDGFKTVEINYQKGDSIYLTSDGFPDQFGGERFKKFMKKRFREMLLSNQDKSFPEQKHIYDETLEKWMSFKDPDGEEIDQTDDVLVIGVMM